MNDQNKRDEIDYSTNLNDYFTNEELERVFKEVEYIEKHPDEYESFKNIQELKESLEKDD